jgi:hypothetical protein
MRYITVTLAYLLYALPQTAGAAGLVPCGGTGQAPCQTCDLVVLSNNVLLWIFGILATHSRDCYYLRWICDGDFPW